MEKIYTLIWSVVILTLIILLIIIIYPRIPNDDNENQSQTKSNPVGIMTIMSDLEDPFKLTFDFSNSYDPDDDNITFFIDFGDGSTQNSLTEPSTTHEYQILKGYWIEFYVRDSTHRKSDVIYQFVNLSQMGSLYPVANILPPGEYYMDEQPVLLSGHGSYDIDGEIIGYYWDFGDGDDSGGFSPSKVSAHEYDAPGIYTARLIVRDDSYNEAVTEVKVIIYANH